MTCTRSPQYALWDLAFLFAVAAYALVGLWGVTRLSCNGLAISSDLCCYAQNMAGELRRGLFAQDPLLAVPTTANSIINVESELAALLQPGGDVVRGLLRAAAAGVFLHYVGCYYLGRRLLGAPPVAALFALLAGVTVWVNFGTYWGFGSGDITPRVFYAALFPVLLAGTLAALDKPQWRPVILFASGCGMYLHGISSLVASCMLFTVFFFHRAPGDSLPRHGLRLLLSLLAWSLPTLLYLGSSIKHAAPFTTQDLAVLQQVFDRRFLEDEGNRWHRLISLLHYRNDAFPLVLGGLVGFFVTRRCGTPPMKRLAAIMPALFLGICLAVLLSVMETSLAHALHRLPMGSELLRGTRFVIFLCWLMILCAFACFWRRFPRWAAAAAVAIIFCVLVLDQGRGASGARFAFRQALGLPQPAAVQEVLRRGTDYARALEALERLVPPQTPVFAAPDAMAVRYRLYRPLAYAFKDGSSYLYNQDPQGAARWLALVAISDARGATAAWLASGAQWFLCGDTSLREQIARQGSILWSNGRWLIARRDPAAEPLEQ